MTPELINSLHLNSQARAFMGKMMAQKGVEKPARSASSIQASTKEKVLDLFLYGQVGMSWYEDGVGAADVAAALAAGGDYDRIHLRINSPGGSVFEGSAIYSLLQSSGKPVDVRVDGIAASAAFTIAMVGETITVNEAAMMMLHNSWGLCIGDADDMIAEAGLLQQINGVMANIYAKRSGMPLADVGALMKAETWMAAQGAVDKGFATSVANGKDAGTAKQLAASFNLNRFARAVPKELQSAEDVDCTCTCPACAADDCDSCTCPSCACEGCDCDQAPAAKVDYSMHERRLRAAALRF